MPIIVWRKIISSEQRCDDNLRELMDQLRNINALIEAGEERSRQNPIPSRAQILSEKDTDPKFSSRLHDYTGDVYYPCAGGDELSLLGLMNLFPKAYQFILGDNFDTQETYAQIPTSNNTLGIFEYLTQEFSICADAIGRMTISVPYPNRFRLRFRVSAADARQAFPGRDFIEVLYRIGDFQDQERCFGAVFVRSPGLGGRLSANTNFWPKLYSQLTEDGLLLTGRGVGRPGISGLAHRATLIANTSFSEWSPIPEEWAVYQKRE